MSGGPCNIAAAVSAMAARRPDAAAIHHPVGRAPDGSTRYLTCTYRELDRRSDAIARGLVAVGLPRGTRAVLMVKPGIDLFALTFGMFKAGVVPVMVDPGIGRKSLRLCLAEAQPQAFIGIPLAHAARVALGWGRPTVKQLVTVGRRWFWGGSTLAQVEAAGAEDPGWKMADTRPDEVAAILFTSGATGVPKGVVYEHRHFVAQVALIGAELGIEPGEVDLPTFPLFALFDPALGMTTVIPEMDFTRPARVDPTRIADAVRRFSVTNMFGSPALLDTVSRWGEANGEKLPGLRRVISAGAPVPASVMARFVDMLDEGARIYTPYGATECLPVAITHSGELLGETRARTDAGEGVCVGLPVAANDVRIIAIEDGPIARWTDDLALPAGQIGEITVAGPTATGRYHGREASTALAKIRHEDGTIRHRMGDVGWLDERGRLWFCGRKDHRVQTADGVRFTVPCEAVFNTHPLVARSALVGLGAPGAQRPVLCVQLEPGVQAPADGSLQAELAALSERHAHTRGIVDFLVHPGFPVDIRHNAKIDRPALARWAAGRLGRGEALGVAGPTGPGTNPAQGARGPGRSA